MSKRNSPTRRGRSTSPFVMLHWHLLDSQGWHQLSPRARLAYLELAQLYNGENNGRIALSARRLACRMPCDKATASRALRELEDAGFIQTMRVGAFTRKDRLASEYRLTNFTCDATGEQPSRKWNGLRWQASHSPSKSYRTGARTRHSEAETPSMGRPNRTISPEFDPSTVRANRTHLESAMGGTPNGHARQSGHTRSGEAEDQDAGLTVAANATPSQTSSNPGSENLAARSFQAPEYASSVEFPELPDFLRRVRLGTSRASAAVAKEKSG